MSRPATLLAWFPINSRYASFGSRTLISQLEPARLASRAGRRTSTGTNRKPLCFLVVVVAGLRCCCYFYKVYFTDKMCYTGIIYMEIRHHLCSGHLDPWLQVQLQIQVNAGYSAGELQRIIIVLGRLDLSRVAPVLSVHYRVV